ncbi:uncharacterized protein LOC106770213 [Vigna radiata var. radiata]|uniref:Uncharacterized protein LOC106770213 n=1 Tax=Vigna radiata var. radiata TaxID=3916 RepID=A0A1S3V004_VIGRR|nr:uncharacterized protein LOC106770213 [Vigna radiata var. radiata]
MITVSRSSKQPQFMPIQRSVDSEETFQKVVKSNVFYVGQREEREACEMITRSGKVLEERRVEKESVEKKSEQEEDRAREKDMINKKIEGDKREEVEKLREKEYVKPFPYPKRYSRKEKEKQFERFMEIFRKKIRGLELKPMKMTLQLADRSLKYPYGVAEDIARILIDVENGKLKVIVQDEEKQNFERIDPKEKVKESKLELKELPLHLKYVFLEANGGKPVIISKALSPKEEEKLVEVLNVNKGAIGWSIADLKGISPTYCMHMILMESDYRPVAQPQRRLNPVMKEVVRKEVLKLLKAGIIYPISDSKWVSPVQVVLKKGGMTVIHNEKNELIPTRTVTGWRMCKDYRKLNTATRKDHFPLPFMDQMLERLVGQAYYCFLDGYFGYNQIVVDPEDQEKIAFTCPFGIFAYSKMPFGLCNAPATFQRCMQAIFVEFMEKSIEVFMDDFSVFGDPFQRCLTNLDAVLKRCIQTNLVLNWEKCHFMVTEGIVLGHKISSKGIEVNKAKVEVIEKLPPPSNVKEIRSFLGHAGFYRRFIKDFSKIGKPLSNLLVKDTPFEMFASF